jgi:hypothetical protein
MLRGMKVWPAGWSPSGGLSRGGLGLPALPGRGRARPPAAAPAANLRPSPRAEAEARALAFASRHGRGAFKALSRQQVARGAIARLHDPNRIAQGASSLCGPAALVRSVAAVDPVGYVDYVTQLFEFGRAKLHSLEVEAGEDLRAYDPGNQLDHADWIALASLRDSENYFFDYQAVDNEFAGITLPSHLEGWFHKVGFTRVVNDTNLIIDKDVSNVRAANELYKQDYWVCLFINANMLSSTDMSSGSFSANHWVVLSSRVRLAGDQIAFTVFSWGAGFNPVPPIGRTMSVEAFLDNYYGYVAAKY